MMGTHPDVRQIGAEVQGVFDMPSVAYPATGELGSMPAIPPAPPPEPLPQPQPQPQPLPPPVPGFDDIFGTGGDTDG